MDSASYAKTDQWQEGAENSFQSSKPWTTEKKWTGRFSKNHIQEVMYERRYRKITESWKLWCLKIIKIQLWCASQWKCWSAHHDCITKKLTSPPMYENQNNHKNSTILKTSWKTVINLISTLTFPYPIPVSNPSLFMNVFAGICLMWDTEVVPHHKNSLNVENTRHKTELRSITT